MRIINLCFHPIVVWNDYPHNGGRVCFELPSCTPEEEVRSVKRGREELRLHDSGFAFWYIGDQKVKNMPAEVAGTYYIVSAIVAAQLPDRKDLLTPGPPIKREGVVVGCLGLMTYNPDL